MKKIFAILLFVCLAISSFPQEIFLLRDAVHKYISQSNSNFNFAMLAEAYNKQTRVAFFWPCLIDSVIVDDKIFAVAFEKDSFSGEWMSSDMFIASNDTNMTNFKKAMGGNDYKVVKPSGAPIENFGNFMYEKLLNVHKAIVKKENEKAILEMEEFSRAFGLKTCAFSTIMSDFIMRGANVLDISDIKISHVQTANSSGSATLDIYFPSKANSNSVKLVKIGTGWAIDDIQ